MGNRSITCMRGTTRRFRGGSYPSIRAERETSDDAPASVERLRLRRSGWTRLLGLLVCAAGYLYEHITGKEIIHADYDARAYTQREFLSGSGYGHEEDYATEMTVMAPFTASSCVPAQHVHWRARPQNMKTLHSAAAYQIVRRMSLQLK